MAGRVVVRARRRWFRRRELSLWNGGDNAVTAATDVAKRNCRCCILNTARQGQRQSNATGCTGLHSAVGLTGATCGFGADPDTVMKTFSHNETTESRKYWAVQKSPSAEDRSGHRGTTQTRAVVDEPVLRRLAHSRTHADGPGRMLNRSRLDPCAVRSLNPAASIRTKWSVGAQLPSRRGRRAANGPKPRTPRSDDNPRRFDQ